VKLDSLKFRLLAAWALFIALTLVVAGLGLRVLYERGITRRTVFELEADLKQLRRGFEISPNGEAHLARPPTDPQFETAFGGRYWQISRDGKPFLMSASLSGQSLEIRETGVSGVTQMKISGPQQQTLLAVVRKGALKGGPDAPQYSFLTAIDSIEIKEDVDKFFTDIIIGLSSLATLLLAGAWAQVAIGLKPLEALRTGVASVRNGTAGKIEGDFPAEVMPLIDETNALLAAQDAALDGARARASDLAHGLKTPLAVLAATSRDLRRQGLTSAPDDIDSQIEAMRRHVDRELARTRARGRNAARNARSDLALAVRELVATFQKLPRAQQLTWDVQSPAHLTVAVDRDDLNNILGNLLDNAHKWTASRIRLVARSEGPTTVLSVEDDGPGVDDLQFEHIVKRGERADTTVAGTGLGLAIVSDIVELNGGRLKIERSSLGGLKATIVLPDPPT
jgi:signal transduction histidine kinase